MTALAATVMITGCAVRGGYYDSRYSDYHRWGPAEYAPYSRWEVERHREHREYRRLKRYDRDDYWRWRHDHR